MLPFHLEFFILHYCTTQSIFNHLYKFLNLPAEATPLPPYYLFSFLLFRYPLPSLLLSSLSSSRSLPGSFSPSLFLFFCWGASLTEAGGPFTGITRPKRRQQEAKEKSRK